MAVALPFGAPLTVDDLQSMPEDGHRYELVDGSLFVTPGPNLRHQTCLLSLAVLMHGARPPGYTVLFAPFAYRPSTVTELQPDLLVAMTVDFGPDRIERPPLLVVEVASPSTRRYDLGTKRLAYQDAGVAAYWLVDPDEPGLTVLHLEEGRLVEHARVAGDEPYRAGHPYAVTVVPARLVDGA